MQQQALMKLVKILQQNSIEDVIEADDIDIYRNLSEKVTTIQILHGSSQLEVVCPYQIKMG